MFEINAEMKTFLPEGADLDGYIDISTVGQELRVFFNPNTGHTIDCNALFAQFQKSLVIAPELFR